MNTLAYSSFSSLPPLAQAAIWIVTVLAIVGIMIVMAKAFGVAIPGWLVTVLWICAGAAVAILAIRFVVSL